MANEKKEYSQPELYCLIPLNQYFKLLNSVDLPSQFSKS